MATFPASDHESEVTPRGVGRRLFKSSGGRFFHFAFKLDFANEISVAHASDPTGTWTQNLTNSPGFITSSDPTSLQCHQDGDIVHCAYCNITTGAQGTFYAQYDMSLDSGNGAWVDLGASDFEIEVETAVNNTGDEGLSEFATWCDIAKRANGDIIVAYQGNRHRDMGNNYANIVFRISSDNGVTWSASPILFSPNSGANHYLQPRLVVTENGRVYCFYNHSAAPNSLMCSMLRPTDTSVSTASPDNLDIEIDQVTPTVIEYPVGIGTSWRDSAGVIQVGIVYSDGTGNGTTISLPDSDDLGSATISKITDVTAGDVFFGELVPGLAMLTDGFEKYVIFNDASDDDLKFDLDDTTDVLIVAMAAGDFGDAYAIYDDDGPKLGCVFMDTSVNFDYIEVDIAKTTGNLADVVFPDQNQFVGPFED